MADEHELPGEDHPIDPRYRFWRRVHLASSTIVAVVALSHCALTFVLYDGWSPDAVWFLGTGLGLLFLAISNRAHIGIEPCSMPTAPLVRWANWVFAVFGLTGLVAVPELQAGLLVGGLVLQALAGTWTLVGPPLHE